MTLDAWKIDQTTFGNGEDPDDKREPGNCFEACVATIFGVTIDEVPFFGRSGPWWSELRRWCQKRGYEPVTCEVVENQEWMFSGLSIACGWTSSNVRHAVVHLGSRFYHDPHPNCQDVLRPYARIIFAAIHPGRK